jgi:hypothetical protein
VNVAHLSRRRAIGAAATVSGTALFAPLAAASAARAHGSHGSHGSHSHRTVPVRRAHAHNDYEHPRPLFDALDHGFASVEADIWLVDGELLIAHDEWQLDPARTLAGLYLDPLFARVRANHGAVYRGYHDLTLQLLIDIKTEGDATYRALSRLLRRYRRMLSTSAHGRIRPGAVRAVISGDRAARVPMEAERIRPAFYDGRMSDLGSGAPASLISLISDNWTRVFTWTGEGPMPAGERARLHAITRAAHGAGQQVRFWATPDAPGPAREAIWRELLAARVDYLNTDDLPGLEAFLRANDPA